MDMVLSCLYALFLNTVFASDCNEDTSSPETKPQERCQVQKGTFEKITLPSEQPKESQDQAQENK